MLASADFVRPGLRPRENPGGCCVGDGGAADIYLPLCVSINVIPVCNGANGPLAETPGNSRHNLILIKKAERRRIPLSVHSWNISTAGGKVLYGIAQNARHRTNSLSADSIC